MTGWAADRHITPRVMSHIAAHLPDVPRRHRPKIGNVGAVLYAMCRWARREPNGEHDGMWLTDETVDQLMAQTMLTDGVIRDILHALEYVGATVTLSNGGGRGLTARGATRRLVLDPVDNGKTARAKPAEYKPKLRGQTTKTPRAKRETPRATARDTASSAFYYVDRAPADAADASTAITIDDGRGPVRPTDVLRCPALPARLNASCSHKCDLCHGMGVVYAEQLGVTG